jgi:hypothetical protein
MHVKYDRLIKTWCRATYDRAASLLADLKQLAAGQGTATDFSRRLAAIREHHARKGQFIMRLQGL